jgi:hypothetical protein
MDLSSQSSIGSAFLIRIAVPNEPVTTFTDYWKSITYDGTPYTGLGSLMGVTATQNTIRATSQNLTITISGIPAANLSFATQSLLRGSPVEIWRYVFNPQTGAALTGIGDNPAGRFFGIINNYTITYDVDPTDASRTSTATILLDCTSSVDILANKVAGRRTTPEDMKRYFPGDLSMDRVPNLANSNFNFGAPQ